MNPCDAHLKLPVIRMVFALASSNSAITVVHTAHGGSNDSGSKSRFTSYDIWCAGLSTKTFAVIRSSEDANDYRRIMRSFGDLEDVYNAEDHSEFSELQEKIGAMRRKMHPF